MSGKFFDKGRPILKEYCKICQKEIEPGHRMIIETVQPSKGRSISMRVYSWQMYGHIDNADKDHKECFIKKIK